MSSTLGANRPAGQKKTFGKSTREVPHHTEKAKKWYPAEDETVPRKVGSQYSTGADAFLLLLRAIWVNLGVRDRNCP